MQNDCNFLTLYSDNLYIEIYKISLDIFNCTIENTAMCYPSNPNF